MNSIRRQPRRDSLTLVNAFLALDGRQAKCTVTRVLRVPAELSVPEVRVRRRAPLLASLAGGGAVVVAESGGLRLFVIRYG
jgi:hypothetical protein